MTFRRSHRLCWLLMVFMGAALTPSLTAQTRPVANPREMLRLMQIDESYLRFFQDDTPIHAETEALEKLLFRLPSFAQVHLDRWSQPIENVDAVLLNPDSYRFEMHLLRGSVAEIRQIDVIPESRTRLGFDAYFEILLDHDETRSLIFARQIPRRWLPLSEKQPVWQFVSVQAMLLKRTVLQQRPALVFAADRIRWHPQQQSDSLGVSNDQVLLGQLGLDVDRLADVVHKSPIIAQDRECFYQLMSAVRRVEPEQLAKLGRRTFDIAQFIQRPASASGELFTLEGTARRAIRIQVDDVDIRERFGISEYYEIEVFVPLEKQVRFLDPALPPDQEGKVFRDYPFVVCVPALPDGMTTGDDIRTPISFSGFFLKLWAYRTEFMSGGQQRTATPRLQQSPLFVGPTVVVDNGEVAEESQLSLYIAGLFLAALSITWFTLWRASVRDRVQMKTLLRKHEPTGNLDSIAGDES